jgi:phage FluMu protein Com
MDGLKEERCPRCGKLLCKLRGQAEIKCPKCSMLVRIDNVNPKDITHSRTIRIGR